VKDFDMRDDDNSKSSDKTVSRRTTLALTLGVASLGLALGKRTAYARNKSAKMDPPQPEMTAKEKSIYIKLTDQEQSMFLKLDGVERSQFIKLNPGERSEFLKGESRD
jgi:hypothetical protein